MDIKHDLNSIAKNIVLNNTTYVLVGIVHYMQYKNSTDNGHYIVFAFAGTKWYEYDDLKKKRIIVNSTQIINPHVILYVKYN